MISYAELSFGCTSITSVRFCLTFLRIIEHREAISSRASTHVRAEIPIHIPIMPPISDRNLADCWRQQFKTNKVWPSKVFTRKLYTWIKKKSGFIISTLSFNQDHRFYLISFWLYAHENALAVFFIYAKWNTPQSSSFFPKFLICELTRTKLTFSVFYKDNKDLSYSSSITLRTSVYFKLLTLDASA